MNKEKYNTLIKNENIDDLFIWENRYVPDSEIRYYFSACDVVALPYKSATQSGIIPLAYNYNKPVITNNTGGNIEMADNNKSGWIVNNNDVNQYIKIIIDNIYQLDKFEEYIRMEYKHKFSWNNFVNKLTEVFYE